MRADGDQQSDPHRYRDRHDFTDVDSHAYRKHDACVHGCADAHAHGNGFEYAQRDGNVFVGDLNGRIQKFACP
jgi:hypothetical protein